MSTNFKADLRDRSGTPMRLLDHRKNVYSQRGEDGIIEAILLNFPKLDHWCVEFGASDGVSLSNTRNLIENWGYNAILIEPDPRTFQKLKENTKDFTGVMLVNRYVGVSSRDGVDVILSDFDCPRNFDFLSIDVDGVDIHIWRAIENYRPKLVCVEFNPTIPTEVSFEQPPDSSINWGCSLVTLAELGKKKGYELVCVNDLNAFFVTRELFPLFKIEDNSPAALRPKDAPRNFVFVGYDGTLLLSRDIPIPWHGISISADQIQPVPALLRKYPPNYNVLERYLARGYWFFRRIRQMGNESTNSLSAVVRKLIRKLFGGAFLGALDYYRKPSLGEAWGGPFNGQPARQALFRALLDRFDPIAIIETGTYLGTTTGVMAEAGIPIYTIEANPYNYGFARARLRRARNVTLLQGDSRAELRTLFQGSLRPARDRILFAYLDAHWNADLPLAEELEIVFGHCPAAVVMIDDFQVPDEPDYGYDDYGQGKALTLAYVRPTILAYELVAFYPATPAAKEAGACRGCLVLARGDIHGAALNSLSLLRPVEGLLHQAL